MPTNKDLMNAFCGGKHCHTQGQYDSCKKHWREFGEKENRKGNPITCITESEEHFCYLRYCDARRNSDLRNAFCGGKHCHTQGQFDSCKKHWHEFGSKENRERSPAYCLNQLAKKKAAAEAANAFKYTLFHTKRTWQAARDACMKWGGTLAFIKSAAEQDLVDHFTAYNSYEEIWFGANDIKKKGDWRWADGSKMENYNNWGRGQPDNRVGWRQVKRQACAADCGYFIKWHDVLCSNKNPYLCEKNRDGA